MKRAISLAIGFACTLAFGQAAHALTRTYLPLEEAVYACKLGVMRPRMPIPHYPPEPSICVGGPCKGFHGGPAGSTHKWKLRPIQGPSQAVLMIGAFGLLLLLWRWLPTLTRAVLSGRLPLPTRAGPGGIPRARVRRT